MDLLLFRILFVSLCLHSDKHQVTATVAELNFLYEAFLTTGEGGGRFNVSGDSQSSTKYLGTDVQAQVILTEMGNKTASVFQDNQVSCSFINAAEKQYLCYVSKLW